MRIHEVVVHVGDLDEGIAFYSGVCGFEFIRTVEEAEQRVAVLDAGGVRLTLLEDQEAGITLALPSRGVAGDRERLERQGVPDAGSAIHTDAGGWLAFTDPWGNRLGFWEPR